MKTTALVKYEPPYLDESIIEQVKEYLRKEELFMRYFGIYPYPKVK